MQEKMDIFCPRRSDSDSNHFQSVFLVDEESFNLCRQNEKSKKVRGFLLMTARWCSILPMSANHASSLPVV